MGHVRVTRAVWAKMVFYVFIVALGAGVYLNFGLGWALMTVGLVGVVDVVFLWDVDEKPEKK